MTTDGPETGRADQPSSGSKKPAAGEEPLIIDPSPTPDDEFAEFRPVIRAFARKVVKYGLTTPMIILLEAERPLNWIFSQGLHIVNPTLSVATEMFSLISREELDKLAVFFENRRSFAVLIEEIENQEEHARKLRELEKSRGGRA
jgi:hypothetical protein